jgi:hypothetical protein
MGFDLRETRLRNLIIGVALLGFYIRIELWLMISIDD